MAKISYLDIPSGLASVYKKGLQAGDRFQYSRIRVKRQFLSRNRVRGITLHSVLVELGPVWTALSDANKAAWTAAGAASGLNGFKAFVYDTAARRRAGHSGYATPNDIYQALVGRMTIASPATGLLLEQPHPLTYYVYHKVPGTRSQYNPVKVSEPFGFPLEIGISWRSELTALDPSWRARFYCEITSSYQGKDILTVIAIPFGLSDDWQRATASLASVIGPVREYDAFIEVYNARGNLYFDNVEIKHSGVNFARDANCNNIAQSFTKQYAQVPRHWAGVDIADGAEFASVYYFDATDHTLDLVELESGGDIRTEATENIALQSYRI